jgi:hypothetical protein
MGMMVLSSAVLWAQPAVPGNVPEVVNRVMAVVGGSQVITLQDVREYRKREVLRANAQRRNPLPTDDELALGELINDALFVHEIRHRKGFVMPAGLGDELLRGHIVANTLTRSELVRQKQSEGVTLQQFERELIDRALLQFNMEPIWKAVQVSPGAVREYYQNGKLEGLYFGPFVEIRAFEMLASVEGVSVESIRAMVSGILSVDDFKKIAQEKVGNDGLKATVYVAHQETTYKDDVDATSRMFQPENKEGRAFYFLEDGKTYNVIFIVERGDKPKPKLSDPRVQANIKNILRLKQYNTQLTSKLDRLRQNINVYLPGVEPEKK